MKKIFILFLVFCSITAIGQNIISPIIITLPNTPPANTEEWASAMPPLMITAQTKLVNGKVLPMVTEGKIYVTIKKGGVVVCGYTSAENAPLSNFNSAVKNWFGASAIALLGKTCTLTPGNYEFCVQFYGQIPSAVYKTGIQGEVCKSFTIAAPSAGLNLIRPIIITLPNSPPANTKEWVSAKPPLMIVAQTTPVNGKISPIVTESNLYVTIKKAGTLVCGYASPANAPKSNFYTAVKNWTSQAALDLLGNSSKLTPGSYEFCVQFYGTNPTTGATYIIGEACKPFTITRDDEESIPIRLIPSEGDF